MTKPKKKTAKKIPEDVMHLALIKKLLREVLIRTLQLNSDSEMEFEISGFGNSANDGHYEVSVYIKTCTVHNEQIELLHHLHDSEYAGFPEKGRTLINVQIDSEDYDFKTDKWSPILSKDGTHMMEITLTFSIHEEDMGIKVCDVNWNERS